MESSCLGSTNHRKKQFRCHAQNGKSNIQLGPTPRAWFGFSMGVLIHANCPKQREPQAFCDKPGLTNLTLESTTGSATSRFLVVTTCRGAIKGYHNIGPMFYINILESMRMFALWVARFCVFFIFHHPLPLYGYPTLVFIFDQVCYMLDLFLMVWKKCRTH